LAEKLKKGGSFAKVPALAVAVWLFRGDEMDNTTSPAALIDQLKSDFHFTEAEWMTLFDTSLWSVSTPLLQPRRLTPKQQRDLALTAAAGDELATAQSVDSSYPSADMIQQLTQLGRRQVILQGPPGRGKTRLARQVAALLLGAEQQAVDVEDTAALDVFLEANRWTPTTPPSVPTWGQVQFHANFGYEDFVRGIVPTVSASRNVGFEMVDKVFTQLTHGRTAPSVLLVDEINRADVARVFGELLFALEYRGVPVRHMYQSPALPSDLCVPSDFYMICTANSADRSIAMLDYAFRRRFDFVDVPSSRAVLEDFLWSNTSDVNVERVIAVYVYVTGLLAGNPLLTPGHSYFMRTWADEIAASIAFQILPLLSEYADEGVIDPLQTLEIPDPDSGSSALSLPLRRGSVELVPGIREWIASP
jgi:5-methylcytosine-specific restriction protein B